MRALISLFAAGCLALGSSAALGQAYPSKPVRVIVPAPPGSAPDFLSRLLASKLGDMWGQALVIDNVVGAGGNIGTDRVAKAPADGYTLLFNTIGPIGVNVSLYSKLPFDPVKDFAPITLVAKVANILVVHPGVPVKSVQELIAYAKQNPGKLRYGSPGSGTSNHLSAELLKLMAGIDLMHIPYKSSAQMTTDILGGQVEVVFHNAPVLLPHVKSGALRGLGITSATRNASAPELPTIAEAGVPGFEVTAWFGFMAPANTPAAIVNRIYAEARDALASSELRERLRLLGASPGGSSPQEFSTFIRSEYEKYGKVIKALDLRAE